LLVFPLVDAANFGVNFSVAQFVTWNGEEIVAGCPGCS
jgi:hypothetical protein